MDLLDWVGTLLRRWWLTVPLLVLSLSGVGAVAAVTPWTYEAQASGVLLASPFQAKQAGGNPWLVFDSSLTVTAEVVGREMMDERTAAELKARGLTAAYQVGVAPDSTGPVLMIEVTGSDPKVVKATLDALITIVPERLTKLQAQESVAPRAQIKMNVISASPKAALVSTDKVRLCVMVLFVGLVLTVAVPLFAEVLSERRRAARGVGPAKRGKGKPGPKGAMAGEPRDGTKAKGKPRKAGSEPPGRRTERTAERATGHGSDRAPEPAPDRTADRSAERAQREDELDPMGLTRPDLQIPHDIPLRKGKPKASTGNTASASSASNGATPPASQRPTQSEPDA
ncbi:hypothetical protein [Spirillospora sp. NPDC047279]|uniref:hypothetical protein n=1 Tax=Spirillospora sp. NPDC047279 TaxID=3155478 RepID=UPI00340DDBFF